MLAAGFLKRRIAFHLKYKVYPKLQIYIFNIHQHNIYFHLQSKIIFEFIYFSSSV